MKPDKKNSVRDLDFRWVYIDFGYFYVFVGFYSRDEFIWGLNPETP